MAGFPDVRLEGVSHGEILAWVRGGKGDSTTQALEQQLQQIIQLLHDSGEDVNKAVQRANAGDWQGSTAQSAHGAMVTMRDYDDAMHGHSQTTRYSAIGQSGESVATRSRIPEPASPQGGPGPQLAGATEDPHAQLAANRAAEQHAREVMGQYRDATQGRVSALPVIPPVPKVVLATGDGGSPSKTGGPSGNRGGAPAGSGTRGGSPAGISSGADDHSQGGAQHVSAPPAVQGTDPSSAGAPPNSGTSGPGAVWPGATGPGGPGGSSSGGPGSVGGPGGFGESGGAGTPVGVGGPGGAGASRGPGAGGGYNGSDTRGRVGADGGYGEPGTGRPGSSTGGRAGSGGSGGEGQAGGRGSGGAQPGARGAAGALGAEEAAARRGGIGGGRGSAGVGGMMGGGHGAEGDEDGEHINKYGLPSDEHFDEDDEYLRDPRNRDFFVAPDVIGGPE